MRHFKSTLSGNCKKVGGILFYVGVVYSAGGVAAPPSNEFANVPGLTPLQVNSGNAIHDTCINLTPVGDVQNDLASQCAGMVFNAIEVSSTPPPPDPTLPPTDTVSLGLSASELGAAVQNSAAEELATISRVSTSTLSSQIASVSAHLLTLHNLGLGGGASADDQSGLLNNRLSVFANAVGGFGELSASDNEDASDFSAGGIVIGLDYRITDHFVAGIAGGYTHLDSDYQVNTNVSGGGTDGDFGNLSLFASYDINNFYVDGIFSYGWSAYDLKRSVLIQKERTPSNNPGAGTDSARTASASPDGRQISFAFNGGYNFQHQALTVRPYIGVSYLDGQIDGYTEDGAIGLDLSVDEQNFESLQTVLGAQISYAFSQSFGVIVPQFDFSWHHEFENDQREITAVYENDPRARSDILAFKATTDSPDRDFVLLGAGVSSVLQGGMQLFVNYQTVLGYRRVTSHGFTAGMRLEF